MFSSFERPVFRFRVRSPAHLRHRRRRFRSRPMAQGQRRDADARRVLCAPALFCVSPADLVRRNRPPVRNDGAAGCARHADDGRRRRAALAGTTTEPCGIYRVSARRHVLQRRELRAARRVVRIRRGSALVRHGVLSDRFGFDEHRRRVPGGRRAPQPAHGSDKRAENAGDLRHGRPRRSCSRPASRCRRRCSGQSRC